MANLYQTRQLFFKLICIDSDNDDPEIFADEITVLNESFTPPFYVNEESDVDENLRLKFRYVDLFKL